MGSTDSPDHHIIVVPEGRYCPVPDLVFPDPYTYELHIHASTPADKLAERIRDATILILSAVPFPAAHLSAACTPRLRMIAVMASGTDHVDLGACRARGITVAGPGARMKFGVMERVVRGGGWMGGSCHSLLGDGRGREAPTCGEEVLGLVGFGGVGQRIAEIGRVLGMDVLVAERKGAEMVREGRVAFGDVLRRATVIVLILPKTPDSVNLISTAELAVMQPHAILINVSRGGIVDEEALVAALKAGAAGPANSVLAREETRDLNLILTPHVAWVAGTTTTNVKRITRENIEGWLAGRPVNVVT
ncbi:glycerate dehydrogenase [Teratosphaeria destructans]|uniref:Glycerate dehydrogenase n=1 Tax=Teratosphaeria destructans TaxID=418781 RepID=A0A9W7SUG8_9PEZI|nr:glycerate dehydrogenase [Teratosphaeria destructans]